MYGSDDRGSFGVCKVPAWGVAFLHAGWRTACSKDLGECPSVFGRLFVKKEWLSFDMNQTFFGLCRKVDRHQMMGEFDPID